MEGKSKKSKAVKQKYTKLDNPGSWRKHDVFPLGTSSNRFATRSQTAFVRLKRTPSDLELFADYSRHQPPGEPHLMEVMKGKYGSLPRTIITRSTGQYLSISNDLCNKLDTYKISKPEKDGDETEKEPSLLGTEEPKEPARKVSSERSDMFANFFPLGKKSSSKNADVNTPSEKTVADVKMPSIETVADVKRPSKETVADVKALSKETDADVKTPSKDTIQDAKTSSKETTAGAKTPSKDTIADEKTPPKETAADVEMPSKETAAEVLPPNTQTEFEIQPLQDDILETSENV